MSIAVEHPAPSPSLGREWIEIARKKYTVDQARSPSLGREWIEMFGISERTNMYLVSLLGEGVD